MVCKMLRNTKFSLEGRYSTFSPRNKVRFGVRELLPIVYTGLRGRNGLIDGSGFVSIQHQPGKTPLQECDFVAPFTLGLVAASSPKVGVQFFTVDSK
jgi:hypothetical protein